MTSKAKAFRKLYTTIKANGTTSSSSVYRRTYDYKDLSMDITNAGVIVFKRVRGTGKFEIEALYSNDGAVWFK